MTMTEKKQQIDKGWVIVSLSSIPLIMTLGNSMLIPILPMLENKVDITKLQTSYIITVYSIVAIICIPIAGYLSDRFGRKKIIIPALILTGIGGLIAGISSWKMDDPYVLIIIGRILQGIGASGAMPIVLPLVGDIFKSDKEASTTLGIVETSNTIGKVLSPILGAALAGVIWFLPFLSIPVFSLVSLLLVIFLIKEKDKDPEDDISFQTYWQQIVSCFREHARWLIAVFIIGAILMFILFGFLFYLSNILEDDFSFEGVKKGFLLAIPLLALAIASFSAGKFIGDDLLRMKWLLFVGIVVTGISVIFIIWADHFISLIITFLCCGIGIGLALPPLDALITKRLDQEVRGVITSVYSAMRFIGVALGPPIIAVLMKQNLVWMSSLLVICALIAGVLAFKQITPEQKTT